MTLPASAMNVSTFPEMYERFLVEPLFRPFADALLERVSLRPGDRVLDVACGTGIVARLARARVGATGRVTGVDVSAPMLAVARAVAPDIDWREGPAAALPLGDAERVDVVTCHQGIQFFPDRHAAVREMRRVLEPGGRVAIGAWRTADSIPFAAELQRIAERSLGPIADRRYSVRTPDELRDPLVAAGFTDVRVAIVARIVRFAEPLVFTQLNAMALVGMSGAGKAMSEGERAEAAARVTQESADLVAAYTTTDGVAFELSTFIASATAR